MWAAPRRAHPTIRCVWSSPGISVPLGTSWSPCVLVHLSHLHCAPQSCIRPVSISLEQLRAGGGKLFTLASSVFAGESIPRHSGNIYVFSLSNHLLVFLPQVSEVPLVSGFLFNWFCSSYLGTGQHLHWPTVSRHVQWSRCLRGWDPLCL